MIDDKEYAKQKKRVRFYIDKWQTTLGLGMHKLNVEWDRGLRVDDEWVAIHCSNSWQYKSITFLVYLPIIKDQSEKELEDIVVHEFCHSLIAPVVQANQQDDGFKNVHEFATECINQAILWAYEKGKKEGIKK